MKEGNQHVARLLTKIAGRVREKTQERRYRDLTATYDIQGHKRIYLVHVRKTGGTSVTRSFLALAGHDPEALYRKLDAIPEHRTRVNGKVFVLWNRRLINRGHYFYASSHQPLHRLALPPSTFTVTCLRDPLNRLISHYNMLMHYSLNNIPHACMRTEGQWLGASFDDFLDRLPARHFLNQLYTFSARFDVEEAAERIAGLSHFFFTEDFDSGLDGLSRKTGLTLEPVHANKAAYKAVIPESSRERARDVLAKEYDLLARVRALRRAVSPTPQSEFWNPSQ